MSIDPDNEAEVLTPEVTAEAPPTDAAEAAGSETLPATSPAQAAQVSPEIERKARDMGWVPQAEWRGSPDAWRPADQFVKRGEEVLPIVRSNLERERRERQRLEAELRELPKRIYEEVERTNADRFKRMEAMNRLALDKQRERIWQEAEEKKRAAVEAGDVQAYDRIAQDQRKALAEFHTDTEIEEPAEPAKPNGKDAQPQVSAPPAVQDWLSQNTWFTRDQVMTAFATEEHGRLLRDMPGLTLEDNLARTREAVMQKFPERFGISPQAKPTASAHAPAVEGGGRQAQASAARTRGWNDLPPEAKAAGDHFINDDGLFLPKGVSIEDATETDIKKAREDYARRYWS